MIMSRRIAIIGAGPIGLEAALAARNRGHDVVIYERGLVSQNVRAWGFVTLFSPWHMNTTPAGWTALRESGDEAQPHPDVCPSGEEMLERYLLPLAASRALRGCIRERTTVISVGREDFTKSDAIAQPRRADSPFRILLRDARGVETIESANILIDCSGTYAHHRWAGRGGIPAPGERNLQSRIAYTIPDILGADRARFAGRHTLLLGAGFSAATALQNLGALTRQFPSTRVSWAIRRISQALQAIHDDPLQARANLTKSSLRLADDPPQWLQYLGNCTLERIDEGEGAKLGVTLRYGETDLALAVDELIALVGYSPDATIYEQLQVHQCYATAGPMNLAAALLGENAGDCLTAGDALSAQTLRNPETDFYILGAKSFGTNSNFLLRSGHRQIDTLMPLLDAPPRA
jgi:hypothetical protein